MIIAYVMPMLCLINRFFLSATTAQIPAVFEVLVYILSFIYLLFNKSSPVKKYTKNASQHDSTPEVKLNKSNLEEETIKEESQISYGSFLNDLESEIKFPIHSSKPKVLPNFNPIIVPMPMSKSLTILPKEENISSYIDEYKEINKKIKGGWAKVENKRELESLRSMLATRKTTGQAPTLSKEREMQLYGLIEEISIAISKSLEKQQMKEMKEKQLREEQIRQKEENDRKLKEQQEKEKNLKEKQSRDQFEKELELKKKSEQDKLKGQLKNYGEKYWIDAENDNDTNLVMQDEATNPVSPIQNRDIPPINPTDERFKQYINAQIIEYNKKVEEGKRKLPRDLLDELNCLTNQMDTHRGDQESLKNRINAALSLLNRISADSQEFTLITLSEKLIARNKDIGADIDSGPLFTLNVTDFIFSLAQQYPSLHRNFYYAIVSKLKIMIPTYGSWTTQDILSRSQLKDVTADQYSVAMDTSRAFGILLGTYFTHPASHCNIQDCWRWLSFVLNIPFEYIDRSYMATLEGFLKVTGPFMKEKYGKQYAKIVKLLQNEFLTAIKNKFSFKEEHKAFITQLDSVLRKL
ncbi:unnamed protein product [Blepharisma stoltei]|uniref:Nucleoporin GLE1 n=1 Tax=Blepharisma stoltei TaxID=1481888 RepID=A0AAU9IJT5_9CILI|nr:unnamed protein product [Blepharisma stoltei]